ncbi:MAG: hypothetical protein IPM18_16910 [Phycisphaerales bacterium]|nr:hypothetical protein [Phycisphaerales bacterium]
MSPSNKNGVRSKWRSRSRVAYAVRHMLPRWSSAVSAEWWHSGRLRSHWREEWAAGVSGELLGGVIQLRKRIRARAYDLDRGTEAVVAGLLRELHAR